MKKNKYIVDINYKNDLWYNRDIIIKNAIEVALEYEIIPHSEISIVLSDDDFIQKLNSTYRNQNKPTNVLSFPQATKEELSGFTNSDLEPPLLLGDIILAFETIQREAEEQNKSFENHFIHLLIHGVLHLLGYDHQSDDEAHIMEEKEVLILSKLGIKNPYENQ